MTLVKTCVLLAAILTSAILFGFFFALSFSVMPGLDGADPYAALVANQQIGRATKESYFFIALLGTPALLVGCLLLSGKHSLRAGRPWLALALLSFIGMMIVTASANVPLNEYLDGLKITNNQTDLVSQWSRYSTDWQWWNLWRVALSGLTVLAACLALVAHTACTMSGRTMS